ncbi:hypothetical protein EDD22DRAFT_1005777 [Suillus occidentalis]|nr:hypothetical protein EDD22DRAFT_1005777 [Suillus occidentalis]
MPDPMTRAPPEVKKGASAPSLFQHNRSVLSNRPRKNDGRWKMKKLGANREVKKAVEVNWTDNLSAEELIKAASDVKKSSWIGLKERGVDSGLGLSASMLSSLWVVVVRLAALMSPPVKQRSDRFDSYYHVQYAFAYAELVTVLSLPRSCSPPSTSISSVHSQQLGEIITTIKCTPIILFLDVVSGRNIWKKTSQPPSSLHRLPSLLSKLAEQQRDWFSFALEKASKVATIATTLSGSQDPNVPAALEANKVSIAKRRQLESTSDDAVRKCVAAIRYG